jgi:hypothetical protein
MVPDATQHSGFCPELRPYTIGISQEWVCMLFIWGLAKPTFSSALYFDRKCLLSVTLLKKLHGPSRWRLLCLPCLTFYNLGCTQNPGARASGLRGAELGIDPKRARSRPPLTFWKKTRVLSDLLEQPSGSSCNCSLWVGRYRPRSKGFRFCLEKARLPDVWQLLISKGFNSYQAQAATRWPLDLCSSGRIYTSGK